MATATKLNVEPSNALQRKIVSHFWRKPEDTIEIEDYVSYFYHYNRTCRALYLGALRTESMAIVVQTHEDLIDMVDITWTLSDNCSNFDRQALRTALEALNSFKEQPIFKINNSIHLLMRLWLTIRTQDKDFAPACKTTQWDDTSKIQDFLLRQFPVPKLQGPNDPGKLLESNFTAVNLYRMCGIRVEWICQLEDHLKFDIERRVLLVYSLAECLQGHLHSSTILPGSLSSETLLSLGLLFPNWDIHTERYLRNSHHVQFYDHPFEYPCHLNEFYYWRDRLARIHHEFQSPGPGWRQLWSDRRNPMQWYTFWFAVAILILTLFFGALTTILTFFQTLYTYQGLQLARAAASSPVVSA